MQFKKAISTDNTIITNVGERRIVDRNETKHFDERKTAVIELIEEKDARES